MSNTATRGFRNGEGLDDLAGWPGGGLCCPDDPLDDVMDCCNLPVLDGADGFMAALGMGGEEDFDVDMFFADGAPDDGGGGASSDVPCHAARVLPDACGAVGLAAALDSKPPLPAHQALDSLAPTSPPHDALDVFATVSAPPLLADDELDGYAPVSAPELPAHDALDGAVPHRAPPVPAMPPTTTSSTSSGSTSSMTSWDTVSEPCGPLQHPACMVVQRKKRGRPLARRNHFWLPKSRLGVDVDAPPPLPPPPPPASLKTGGENGADVEAPPPLPPPSTRLKTGGNNGAGAGVSRKQRPVVARQRNRQRERACSHCGNKDTPQWRTGPRGPGTLCNACGIRFKQIGRLFEEYRPSTSPSFESGKHSNRQRKVVKLMERKLKRMAGDTTTTPAPAPSGDGDQFMDVCTYISTGL